MPNLQIIQELTRVGRKTRRPNHTFQLRQRPYQIQPFLLAPVLPGETLKNLLMQARVVSDPIKNPLIGWWAEYFFFYVKHRDLVDRDTLSALMITPGTTLTSLHTAAVTETYHYASAYDWAMACLRRVTEEYFRDEGEAWNVATLGNLPLASVQGPGWVDSLIDETLLPEGDDPQTTPDGAEDLNQILDAYEYLRRMKMLNMTYEDFLASYGVKGAAAEDPHKPELIRFVREWTYPTNTVDPTTGTPSSAVSWAVSERADKDRFFKEPGFIFGVCVMRPKVYFSKQRGVAAHMLDTPFSWLPALMADQPETSLREFTNANGPLTGTTNGYWVDVRDLFLYGDQFVNFALTETNAGFVALPTAAMGKRFASSADVDGLFSAASPANQVRQDGVVNLSILGAQIDHT